jgi:hypothetical protein
MWNVQGPECCVRHTTELACVVCAVLPQRLTCSDRSRICLSSYCLRRVCAVLRAFSSFTQRPSPTSHTTCTATPHAFNTGRDWL